MNKQTLRPPDYHDPNNWGFFISRGFFNARWSDNYSPGNEIERDLFTSLVFKTGVEETVDFMGEDEE